jgi:NAD(P) transhydrogenase subunit alpha
MVRSMKKGSVIVDLAAENGGNCAVTHPGSVVERHGVHVIGYVDLPSRLAPTASQLYGTNLAYLLAEMGGAKSFHIDLEDEVIRGALVTRNGEVMWPPPRKEAPPPPPRPDPKLPVMAALPGHPKPGARKRNPAVVPIALVAGAAALVGLGLVAPPSFLSHLTVFALACVIGWQVIWNVTPALHTPLMSVTNAISGIIVVGGMLQVSAAMGSPPSLLGAGAILLAAINIVGGFLVTGRMLRMFRR